MQQLTLFDYGQLTEPVREQVEARVVAAKNEMKSAAQNIVNIGREIKALRDLLSDDQFEQLVQAEFGYSLRSTRRYIRLYDVFGGYDFSGFGSVSLDVMEYLANDTVPLTAQEEAVEWLNDGRDLTRDVAKEIVRKHRPELPGTAKTFDEIMEARNRKLERRWPVTIVEQLSGCMSDGCGYPIATRAHRVPWSVLRENFRVLYLCPNCHYTYDTLFQSYWKANAKKRRQLAKVLREAFGDTPRFERLDRIARKEVEWLENYEDEQAELAAHVNGRNGND